MVLQQVQNTGGLQTRIIPVKHSEGRKRSLLSNTSSYLHQCYLHVIIWQITYK